MTRTWSLCLGAIAFAVCSVFGQTIFPPAIQWDVHYGGTNTDGLFVVRPTTDGGWIAGGYSWPGAGGTKEGGSFGSSDYSVVRLNAAGNRLWDRSFGGSYDDVLTCLTPTGDGGYLLGGRSASGSSGNKSAINRGNLSYDFWIVRIDTDGNKHWDQSYGGNSRDDMTVVQPLTDGGFLLGGGSESGAGGTFGNKSATNWGGQDIWVVRVDATGNKLWDRSFGGSGYETLSSVEATSDGGFLLAGSSDSINGNRTNRWHGMADYWLIRLDAAGNKLWDKSYGGSSLDVLFGARSVAQDEFLLAGFSRSPNDGSKTTPAPPTGMSSFWFVRVDAAGNQLSDRSAPAGGGVSSFEITPDGGCILAGSAASFGGWGNDFWLLRLDENAGRVWETRFAGGATLDGAKSVVALPDGSFLIGGMKYNGENSYDYRVLKLAPERYTLTLATNFPGRGGIEISATAGVDGRFEGGTVVSLFATPEPGFEFSAWKGANSITDNPVQLLMNGNKRVTADFARVSVPPEIACTPPAVSLLAGDAVNRQELRIWNSGGRTLRYTLAANQSWIQVAPNGGVSVGETNVHRATFVVNSLPGGIYRGTITLVPEDATVSPRSIDVTLRIQAVRAPAVQWQREFNGADDSGAFSIVETPDGGFLLGGGAAAPGADKTSPYFGGGSDFWVVRLDGRGSNLWDRSFGGTNAENIFASQMTSDGGFILGGQTQSGVSGNKTSPSLGSLDYWLVRVDADGNKLWDATFGGTGEDYLFAVAETADGGFIAAGESSSTASGNKTSPKIGSTDYWVVRTDANGQKLWDRSYGGASVDACRSVAVLADGGFALGGFSRSGPALGTKTAPLFGNYDYWIVSANSAGDPIWDRSYGGTNLDAAFAFEILPDGFAIGGRSHGAGGSKTAATFGEGDYWLVRVDTEGNPIWDRSFGGDAYEELKTLVPTRDGGFLVAGIAGTSLRGNKTSPDLGGGDFWVVRTDGAGNKLWERSLGTPIADYVYSAQQTKDGGFVLAGFTWIFTNNLILSKALVFKLAPEAPLLMAEGQSPAELLRDGFRLRLLGESNCVYVTESSSDLHRWQPIQTNTAPDIEMEILDPAPRQGASPRFYRARQSP